MRHPDWENRLTDYLISVREKPHAYGSHDCVLFCANAVRALTGKDFARGHRRKYRSQASAVRHLKRLGFSSFAELISSHFEEVPPSFAHRGDIVMGDDGIPGIAMGEFAFFVGQEGSEEGLVQVSRSEWRRAWRV